MRLLKLGFVRGVTVLFLSFIVLSQAVPLLVHGQNLDSVPLKDWVLKNKNEKYVLWLVLKRPCQHLPVRKSNLQWQQQQP